MNTYQISYATNTLNKDRSEGRFPQFISMYRAYCELLDETRKEINETQSVFEDEKVWSDQCEDAIAVLQKLQKITQAMSEIISEKIDIPGMIRQHRYSLITDLCQINAQSREATSYIRNLESTKQTRQLKTTHAQIRLIITEINSSLRKLPRNSNY